MMPLSIEESELGILTSKGSTFSRLLILSTVVCTLDPCLSSLFINPSLGILNLLAYIHTVSLCVYIYYSMKL